MFDAQISTLGWLNITRLLNRINCVGQSPA